MQMGSQEQSSLSRTSIQYLIQQTGTVDHEFEKNISSENQFEKLENELDLNQLLFKKVNK